MDSSSIKADFLAARKKTAITIMNAAGWAEGAVDPTAVGVDSVFFYVFDHQTKWIWSCSVPKDSFHKVVVQAASGGPANHSAIVACCGQLIDECVLGASSDPNRENDLAVALSAYISITQSYQITNNATKQNHFAVIRYGSMNIIRPFVLNGPPQHLIPSNIIHDSMLKVIAIDSKNHPEWMDQPEPRPSFSGPNPAL